MNDTPSPNTGLEELPEVHRREIEEALKEEGRLLRAELVCLLLIAVFVVVRQLWLA
jgi:hypothetical protein